MKVQPELEQSLRRAPQADVAVIVHVQGDPTQYTPVIEAIGLEVVRAFRLTNTLAVRGAALRTGRHAVAKAARPRCQEEQPAQHAEIDGVDQRVASRIVPVSSPRQESDVG